MSGIKITVSMDSAAWSTALDDLLVRLEEASQDASLKGAREIQSTTRGLLSLYPHSDQEYGSTPGSPPGLVSGDLFDSVDAEMVDGEAWVGPTAGYGRSGDYARIQELGGEMEGHPLMIFYKYFKRQERAFVELFPRPYLEPATDAVINSGRLEEIYVAEWGSVIEGSG